MLGQAGLKEKETALAEAIAVEAKRSLLGLKKVAPKEAALAGTIAKKTKEVEMRSPLQKQLVTWNTDSVDLDLRAMAYNIHTERFYVSNINLADSSEQG